jgi:hypothetical protein
VKADRYEQRKLRKCESIRADIDINVLSENNGTKKESPNPKDQNLRVSLIQSRWVYC